MDRRHSLLRRQLKRTLGLDEPSTPELAAFIAAVDAAYRESDADRSMLERALELSSQELLQANSAMRAMFQAFPDVLFRLDREGRIVDYKAGSETDLFLPAEALLGKRIDTVPLPAAAEKFQRAIQEIRTTRAVTRIEYSLTIQGADNAYEARLVPLVDDHVVVIVRNITEQKRAEDALRRSESLLRQSQKMEAIGRLAGGVAHDFNNLLTVILGRSELLMNVLAGGDPMRAHVDLVLKTAERAASLTRQLLAFSRRQVMQPKVIDLNSVVGDMSRMLRRLIGEDIDMVMVLARGLGRVKADPGQLEQVVMNLALNARDAMPTGGRLVIETANVEIGARAGRPDELEPGAYVQLTVRDNGVGMDEATRSRLFEPFFTTKGPGKGTGLGLAMVYGIIEQSGGHIAVASEPGKGAIFEIVLPRVDEEPELPESMSRTVVRHRGSETILLVEDEAEVRVLTGEILESHGYRILSVGSPSQAPGIAKRHEGPIDLLLTDVVMPDLSGSELARQLATLRPDIKVLYMSGYTDDALGAHGILDPGIAFLQKPFTSTTLLARVREVLDGLSPLKQ